MEFRWVAALSLWTMLSGPVLTQPAHQPPAAGPRLDAQPPAPKRDSPQPAKSATSDRR